MTDATSRFAALVREPEGKIALDEGALLIAAHAHARLDIDARLTQLDELADTVRDQSPAAITDALFTAGGFAGNTVDYYDPSNSFLDDVLDRRLGIPITLSVLMIEIGRRVGVALHGVGMPGHFLVGAEGGHWYDPFHGGVHLTEEGCAALFTSVHGREQFDRDYLAPVGASAILDRMLANLQQTLLAALARRGGVADPAAAAVPVVAARSSQRAGRGVGKPRPVLRGRSGARRGCARRARRAWRARCARGRAAAGPRELTRDSVFRVPGKTLPMFPLGSVLFPNALMPLRVFEPRYRELTEVCLKGDGRFGVVLIERGFEVGGGDTRFSVGTVARIVEAARTPDGRYILATVGTDRFRVRRWLDDDPYPRASVDIISEPKRVDGRAHDQRDVVERLLVRALALRSELGEPAAPVDAAQLDADPIRASFEAAAMAPIGPLDAQRLLELDDPLARLDALARELTDAVEVLQFRLADG